MYQRVALYNKNIYNVVRGTLQARERVRISYVWRCEPGSARGLPPMTPQDMQAMVAAGYEYEDAVKAFDAAIEKND